MVESELMYPKYCRETEDAIYFWGGVFGNNFEEHFEWNNRSFRNAEQAFQYAKAIMFDKTYINPILELKSAQRAIDIGRSIPNYNEDKWNEKRYQVMVDILKQKFSKKRAKRELLATGNKELVFGVTDDKIWGAGVEFWSNQISDESNRIGENLLGNALMEVRCFLNKN